MGQVQLSLFPWPEPRPEVQLELFEPTFDSLSPSRKTHVDERIYADMWKKENAPKYEHDSTLLEHLLTPEGARYIAYVSDRDSVVATAVIQWLATNCGSCFLEQCERKIAEAKEVRKPFQRYKYVNRLDRQEFPQGKISQQIKEIISAYIPPDRLSCTGLQNEILNFVLDLLHRGFQKTVVFTKRKPGRVLLQRPQLTLEMLKQEIEEAKVEVNKDWEDRQ